MADNIDPNCHAGVDCEGCSSGEYCPQRDDELKHRQSMSNRRSPLPETYKQRLTYLITAPWTLCEQEQAELEQLMAMR